MAQYDSKWNLVHGFCYNKIHGNAAYIPWKPCLDLHLNLKKLFHREQDFARNSFSMLFDSVAYLFPMDPWAYSGWKNSSKTKLLATTQKKQKKKMLSLGLWVDLLGKPLSVYFFGCSRSPWTEMTTTATLRDVGGFQKSKFPFPAWLLICFLMWEDSSFGKLILLEISSFYKR